MFSLIAAENMKNETVVQNGNSSQSKSNGHIPLGEADNFFNDGNTYGIKREDSSLDCFLHPQRENSMDIFLIQIGFSHPLHAQSYTTQ